MKKRISDAQWEIYREKFKKTLFENKSLTLKEFCKQQNLSYSSARQHIEVGLIRQELKFYNQEKKETFNKVIKEEAAKSGIKAAEQWIKFQKHSIAIDESLMVAIFAKTLAIRKKAEKLLEMHKQGINIDDVDDELDIKEITEIGRAKREITADIYSWLYPTDDRIRIAGDNDDGFEAFLQALEEKTPDIWEK